MNERNERENRKRNSEEEGMEPVEVLRRLLCGCTKERLVASHLAAVVIVACQPSASSGVVIRETGLSLPNICRVLNELVEKERMSVTHGIPPSPKHPALRRRYVVTPSGREMIRRVMDPPGWGGDCRFRLLRAGKEDGQMTALELVRGLLCCCTQSRMMASQLAVLVTVACREAAVSSREVARATGLEMPNVCRILAYLAEVGDLSLVYGPAPVPQRFYYASASGLGLIRRLLRPMGWENGCRILKTERRNGRNGHGQK